MALVWVGHMGRMYPLGSAVSTRKILAWTLVAIRYWAQTVKVFYRFESPWSFYDEEGGTTELAHQG